jgi:DNA phosphorothioation-associated putative methyltransferase
MMMDRLVTTEVNRHKAAIVRTDFSRPVKTAWEAGVISSSHTFFDFGCGHGGDVERLSALGVTASGWDPYFRPDHDRKVADVVNLGYVINVIEDPAERKSVLCEAWSLAQKVLIVSAQVLLDYLGNNVVSFGDGVLTKRNTFQKVFKQEELKEFIDSVLGVDSVPAGLGIFFVFKTDEEAESFRASRFHSRRTTPKVRLRVKTFDDYQEILRPLIDFVTDRGRLPLRGELADERKLTTEFGSITRAFKLVVEATSKDEWDELIERRRQDLSLYIALSKFGKRPRIGQLSGELQYDIKAFFGSYKSACDHADQILFSLGQPGIVEKTCKGSRIGKFVPDGLYVHISALDQLDLILRLYEGCASRTVGRMDEATLVKFHTDKPLISYLFYPDFDTDPHPALHTSMRIDLRDLYVKYSDYADRDNPPILHRKETFVSASYPLYEKFVGLTKQEEELGLLKDASGIGTRRAWMERLRDRQVILEDHCVRVLDKQSEN